MCLGSVFFFFKQKTAYEMRISDWSSDVCSSDLAFSTGSGGVDVDLIQAHKWFNLAALGGNVEGQKCRADVASEMGRDEIAEAQRQARAWLDETARRPAARRFAA